MVNLYTLFVMLMVHFPSLKKKSSHNFIFFSGWWRRQLEIFRWSGNLSPKNHRWPSERVKRKCFPIKNANTHVCNCTWSNFLFPFHVFFSHFIVRHFFCNPKHIFFPFEDTPCSALISSHKNDDVISCYKAIEREKKEDKKNSLMVVVSGS